MIRLIKHEAIPRERAVVAQAHQLDRNASKAWTKRMPMLRTMRAPANAEVMFHFLALSEMTAARCTVKAIHENEGLFCRLMKLSHTIASWSILG